ncbi:ATP synthase F0 subunit B [Virgibacillus phasianinus]|uniref:ATP synthase subunit b n=1 Tax=Virgibacillus phasianinus TaxID=2017483 RepID=A0A220U204_9BACI|nr:F0F1 ATP synthase subunit B [Virgibacillus phasianinus]ASK62085.1 ATP synthase F0 subunit B [Virgibacillus phasianinus]
MQAFTGSTLYAAIGGLHVGDMLVQLVFFIILLILVKKYAWGPIIGMMQKREEYVANEIEIAEQNRAEAERASKEAAEKLRQTKEDAQKIIEDAKHIGGKQEQEIIESARQEAERIKISAQEEIKTEKEKAIQALQDKVASLSVLIASKVIEKEINAEDQEKLIDEYIKEVGEER